MRDESALGTQFEPQFHTQALLDYVLEARKTSGLWHFIAAWLMRRQN